ncbi:MAG: hypothetical protein GF353_26820 [Candidatus Lokiarchaeota archaeon]|nr:hypothetical protein [Candidatus Lokiarchaeota archaeon]
MSKKLLNKEELEIFEITKEYLQKQPISRIVELVRFIDNRLKFNPNFNRNKVEKIVKSLIKKNIILIGTTLTKDDILSVQTRKIIFEHVKQNPGININEIKNEFNLGSNQVLWHLKMLEDFQYIKTVKIGNQKALFDVNFNDDRCHITFHLRNDKIQDIVNLLRSSNEPLRPTNISDTLSIHYNTTKKYLNILLEFQIIVKVNGNKKKRYIINPEPNYIMEKLI